MTSILFLHANAEAYLADSLLHGLRSVLGAEVVDVPRRDSMYRVDDQSLTYGRGFTLYGTLREVPARRAWAIDRALRGEFDVIAFADIWRYWGAWAQMRSRLFELRRKGVTLVAVDGHDSGRCIHTVPPTGKGCGRGRSRGHTGASPTSSVSSPRRPRACATTVVAAFAVALGVALVVPAPVLVLSMIAGATYAAVILLLGAVPAEAIDALRRRV